MAKCKIVILYCHFAFYHFTISFFITYLYLRFSCHLHEQTETIPPPDPLLGLPARDHGYFRKYNLPNLPVSGLK